MKKKIYLSLSLVFFLFAAQAQNGYVEATNGKDTARMFSPGYQIKQIGENEYVRYREYEEKAIPASEKTHRLRVEVAEFYPGRGQTAVVNETGYGVRVMHGETFDRDVPEGYVDIVVEGDRPGYGRAAVVYEQVYIDRDTILKATLADATNRISTHLVDKDGVPFSDNNVRASSRHIDIRPHHTTDIILDLSHTFGVGVYQPDVFISNISSRCKVSGATLLCGKGVGYAIEIPMIGDGLDKDTVFSNNPNDFVCHRQFFNIEADKAYLGIEAFSAQCGENDLFSASVLFTGDEIDPAQPLQLYFNSKLNPAPKLGDTDVFFSPMAYPDDFSSAMTIPTGFVSSAIIATEDDKIVKDDFVHYQPAAFSRPEKGGQVHARLPVSMQYDIDEVIYNHYRTPHLYLQPMFFQDMVIPAGKFFIGEYFCFQGENNERRTWDEQLLLKMENNDVVIFHDSICNFRYPYTFSSPGTVKFTVKNDLVHAHGVNMVNDVVVEVNTVVNENDIYPPTLTLLRIINGDGKIHTGVSKMSGARLEVAMGDFESTKFTGFMKYVGKPDIEMQWSIDDGRTFFPLELKEDADKFHVSYGHFYTVDLEKLYRSEMEGKWITVKIVITDDSQNRQTQVLHSLFYYGDKPPVVGITEVERHLFTAYPNPFTDVLTIRTETPLYGEAYFEVYDITGRIVHQQKVNADGITSFTWNGSYLPAGMYTYAIYNDGKAMRGKVVKQ